MDRKCEKLDRLVTEVQRDVKTLKKAVDSLSSQLDSQSVRERPKMASFIEEINVIKETMSVQVKKINFFIRILKYLMLCFIN